MPKNFGKNEERTLEYLEKFNREKVLKLLVNKNSPVIFDVGANNGSSLIEFMAWWPDSEVHCFEPQEECWPELEGVANSNNKVFINKFALGSEDGRNETFYTHDLNTGISGFNKININSKDSIDISNISSDSAKIASHEKTINHPRKVLINRSDVYIKEAGIKKIDLLKLDTQGYELEILNGFGDSLKSVRVIISELMLYDFYDKSISFYEFEKIISPFGFKLYDINHIAKNPRNGRTDWVDVIYLNENF